MRTGVIRAREGRRVVSCEVTRGRKGGVLILYADVGEKKECKVAARKKTKPKKKNWKEAANRTSRVVLINTLTIPFSGRRYCFVYARLSLLHLLFRAIIF